MDSEICFNKPANTEVCFNYQHVVLFNIPGVTKHLCTTHNVRVLVCNSLGSPLGVISDSVKRLKLRLSLLIGASFINFLR